MFGIICMQKNIIQNLVQYYFLILWWFTCSFFFEERSSQECMEWGVASHRGAEPKWEEDRVFSFNFNKFQVVQNHPHHTIHIPLLRLSPGRVSTKEQSCRSWVLMHHSELQTPVSKASVETVWWDLEWFSCLVLWKLFPGMFIISSSIWLLPRQTGNK